MLHDVESAWLSLRMQLAAHRPDPSVRRVGADPVPTPVCLLTGFLGAGKSFLLSRLLADPPGGIRIKAVVNDVGTLAFDPTLIDSADDVRVELTNGCGCCERTGELAATLASVAEDPRCDLIVLEASGAADPLAVAQVVAADPSLRLDRIVTVVSATFPAAAPPEPLASTVRRQIDSAHCVIVSGCDLVDRETAEAALAVAAGMAPGRTVTPSSIDAPAVQVLLPAAPKGARPAPSAADSMHRDLTVVTVEQRREPTMDELRAVLAASRPGVVRVKGRLIVEGRHYLAQLTPATIDITATPAGPTGLTVIAVDGSAAAPIIELIETPAPSLGPVDPGVRGSTLR